MKKNIMEWKPSTWATTKMIRTMSALIITAHSLVDPNGPSLQQFAPTPYTVARPLMLFTPPPSLSAMILERTCNARGWQRLDLKRWKVIEQRFFLGKVTLHMFADRPTFNVVSMSVQ